MHSKRIEEALVIFARVCAYAPLIDSSIHHTYHSHKAVLVLLMLMYTATAATDNEIVCIHIFQLLLSCTTPQSTGT